MFQVCKTRHSFAIHSSLIGYFSILACSGPADAGREESTAAEMGELSSPTLAVPAGNRLAFYLDALGVQIYTCQSTSTGYAWSFQAPEAALYDRRGRVSIQHYAGPTWEHRDGSKVVAAKVTEFTPDPSAIPELLLEAISHSGKGQMSAVTYIQRLATIGGLTPTSGCDANHVGDTSRIDYTATYYFYETTHGHHDHRCKCERGRPC